MKRTKKLLAVLLSLLMLALCMPFAVAEGGTTGSLTWNYDASSRVLTVSGSGAMPNYTNPDKRPWYSVRKEIQSVVIQDGVTSVGSNAFLYLPELKTVSLANSVASIGGSAFQNCAKLTSADLGTGVATIGSYAFDGCYELASVAMGNNVSVIEKCAFSNCQKLQSLSLSTTVSSIGERAFENCYKLTSLMLPNSLQTIGEKAFLKNTGLETVTIPAGVKSIGSQAFADCTALQTVNFGGTQAQWNAIPKGDTVFGLWKGDSYVERTAGEALAFHFGVAAATLTLLASTSIKPISNSGGKVSGSGTYETGKQITISAVADEGRVFDGWYNVHVVDGKLTNKLYSNATETVTLTESLTLAALFRTALDCTITVTSSEGGTASGGGTYKEGKTAALTAATDDGWHFVGWFSGETLKSADAAYSFTVTGDAAFTAKFEKDVHTHTDDDNNGRCDGCDAQMTGGDHCPKCGKIHNCGFFDSITGFFHRLIYRLTHLFG